MVRDAASCCSVLSSHTWGQAAPSFLLLEESDGHPAPPLAGVMTPGPQGALTQLIVRRNTSDFVCLVVRWCDMLCPSITNISPTLLWKHPDPSLFPLYCAAFVFTLQRIYLLHVSINQIANTLSIHIVIWWWNNVLIKHRGCYWHDIVCPGGGSRSSIISFNFVTCSIAQLWRMKWDCS